MFLLLRNLYLAFLVTLPSKECSKAGVRYHNLIALMELPIPVPPSIL